MIKTTKELLGQFDQAELIKNAQFGIRYQNDPAESNIVANREGLQLFALRLLEAAEQQERTEFPHWFDPANEWMDQNNDVFINHLKVLPGKRPVSLPERESRSWRDNLIPYGCLLLVLVLIFSTIIGLITIIQFLMGN